MIEYSKWSINWIQAQISSQVEPDDPRASYQYVLLGRLTSGVVTQYSRWLYTPRTDQGLHTLLLRTLNPEEYEKRRDLGFRIFSAELAEMEKVTGSQDAHPKCPKRMYVDIC